MMAEAKEGIWVPPNSLELLFDVFHTSLLRGHIIAVTQLEFRALDITFPDIDGGPGIDDRPMCQKIFGEPVREAHSRA